MPTTKQIETAKYLLANPGSTMKEAMLASGYSEGMAKNPQDLTNSPSWQELMGDHLSLDKLARKHERLLNAHKLEHMVFPPEATRAVDPEEEEEEEEFNEDDFTEAQEKRREKQKNAPETLKDADIIEMLAEVGCTVRKIVHGEMARHVYFWSPDNQTQQKVLDMAYKLTGSYAPEKKVTLNLDGEASITGETLAEIKARVRAKQIGNDDQ